MKRKGGLGKGLEALLTGLNTQSIENNDLEKGLSKESLCFLPIEYLQPGTFQPRRNLSQQSLQELAQSIKMQGILQPIIVKGIKDEKNQYEIIAGERRWRAAQLAGLEKVPVLVKTIDPQQMLAIALIENIQREALNPLEEAVAIQRLLEEFNMTHSEIAKTLGKSRTAVSNALRLLQLSETVKGFMDQGLLEMGHARALLALDKSQQNQAAQKVIDKHYSVRETEKLVKRWDLLKNPKNSFTKAPIDPDIKRLQIQLSENLGTKVTLKHHASHDRGKIVIDYSSLDELDGILERFGVNVS
jgi:ParB family chromosome partitioning protein